jgi:hypothetical protein
MTDLEAAMDPRVLLITTLVGLGVTTVEKIHELWGRQGHDDETLDAVIVEAKARIARREAAVPPT